MSRLDIKHTLIWQFKKLIYSVCSYIQASALLLLVNYWMMGRRGSREEEKKPPIPPHWITPLNRSLLYCMQRKDVVMSANDN